MASSYAHQALALNRGIRGVRGPQKGSTPVGRHHSVRRGERRAVDAAHGADLDATRGEHADLHPWQGAWIFRRRLRDPVGE